MKHLANKTTLAFSGRISIAAVCASSPDRIMGIRLPRMKISITGLLILVSPLVWSTEEVHLITNESDYCAGQPINPDHCQEDGICYHFKKQLTYPLEALKNGITGYAKVKFDTNLEGCTFNHQVIEASPTSEFGSAAIKAIKNFQFSGEAKDLVQVVNFEIN